MKEATLLDMYMMALISSGYYNRDDFLSFIDDVRNDAIAILEANGKTPRWGSPYTHTVSGMPKKPLNRKIYESGYTPTLYPGCSECHGLDSCPNGCR